MKKERHFRQRDKPHLLTVEDPQQPGTDIGSGAYSISQVCSYFLLEYPVASRHLQKGLLHRDCSADSRCCCERALCHGGKCILCLSCKAYTYCPDKSH